MNPSHFILSSVLALLIVFCCSFSGLQIFAKNYQVIKVKGNIYNVTQDSPLMTKQRFSSEDELKFSSLEDRIAVIDETKKTYIVQPKRDLKTYSLDPIRAKFNTRPGEILTYIAFVKYLEGRAFLILGDKVKLKIEAPDLHLDDQHFFYIRYKLEGENEAINKKLPFEENNIIISKSELFKVDGRSVPSEQASAFKLFYYNSEEVKSLKINDLFLVFPDEEQLKTEVGILQASYGNTEAEQQELKKAIENYLLQVYGVPEAENLKEWLKNEYDL